MNVIDMLSKEDRVSVTYNDFYRIVKEATKTEIIENAFRRGEDPESILSVMFDEDNECDEDA